MNRLFSLTLLFPAIRLYEVARELKDKSQSLLEPSEKVSSYYMVLKLNKNASQPICSFLLIQK